MNETLGIEAAAELRHELRTPVNHILGYAEMLREDATDESSDATLIAARVKDPSLVNRPIVVTPKGAALCRPTERVLALL